MGRARLDIKKLPPNKINATFNKRKKGLANKARELAVLCDCDVALIVVSPTGDELIDVSYGGTITDIYQKYIFLKSGHHNQNQLVCIPRDSVAQQQHDVHATQHHNNQQHVYIPRDSVAPHQQDVCSTQPQNNQQSWMNQSHGVYPNQSNMQQGDVSMQSHAAGSSTHQGQQLKQQEQQPFHIMLHTQEEARVPVVMHNSNQYI